MIARERSKAASSSGVWAWTYLVRRRRPGLGSTSTSDSCSEPPPRLTLGQTAPDHPSSRASKAPRPAESIANRPVLVRSRSHSCAGFLPTQDGLLQPFALFLLSGGGGNRTRARFQTAHLTISKTRRRARVCGNVPGAPREYLPCVNAKLQRSAIRP